MKIEFDLNSRNWMLKIMRHLRILRWLLPSWHRRERQIALEIRREILEKTPKLERLNALETSKVTGKCATARPGQRTCLINLNSGLGEGNKSFAPLAKRGHT